MKRATTIAALILIFMIPLAAPPPASAHHFDDWALATCRRERLWSGSTIRHAHPVAMTSAYVDYECTSWDGVRCRDYRATRWWNYETTGHSYESPYFC